VLAMSFFILRRRICRWRAVSFLGLAIDVI
jgi:hypothetical protein